MDTSLIIALIGVVTTVAGFLFGSRKRKAEVVGQELSNMQKAIQVWKEVAEFQTSEIASLRKEIDDLKKELSGVERMYREQHSGKLKAIENNTKKLCEVEKRLMNIETYITKNQQQ